MTSGRFLSLLSCVFFLPLSQRLSICPSVDGCQNRPGKRAGYCPQCSSKLKRRSSDNCCILTILSLK